MAIIQKKLDRTLGKVCVEIKHAKSGQGYKFILNKDTVDVITLGVGSHATTDWVQHLTEQEKLDMFNIVLGEHRDRSMGDQDFRLAAIGVTDTGRIYIHENSEQLSTDHNRQCAEQNMVVTAENGETNYKIEQAIRQGENHKKSEKTKPKFTAVYLMGGRDGDIPIACPCGNCTDLLSRVMEANAPVWILPVNDGKKSLRINTTATMASQLDGDEAWKTTIRHLKRPSIGLEEESATLQRQALQNMAEEISAKLEPAVRDSDLLRRIRRGEKKAKLAEPFAEPVLNDPAILPEERDAHINNFIAAKFKNAVLNRLDGGVQRMIRKGERLPDLSPEGIIQLIDRFKIRADCAVIEMEDGTRYANSITKSMFDNAQQPPEVNVVAFSNEKHGTDGIEHVWGQHFGLHTIRDEVLLTSPSAGIERIVKRRPQRGDDKVHFHYLPFNGGGLSEEKIEEIQHNYTGKELFPGYYTGKASQQKQPPPAAAARQATR